MPRPDAQVGKATLRLRSTASGYKGIVIVDGKIKHTEEGTEEAIVWQRLHDAANRLNPSFFGYDGDQALPTFLSQRFSFHGIRQ